MAAASLLVRIGADINDFSSKMKKLTKDVTSAAKSVADVGKAMTIGITLPATLAGLALAKMGMENEQVGRKMERSFGTATDRMNARLTQLMKVLPETGTDMQRMAIETMDLARGLEMAAPKAQLFTEGVMTMAGTLSAAKFISMGEGLDAVQRALEGQTRGLKQYGIVVEQTEVKQEAYRLGLLKTGQALTPLGTALATYSLLSKKMAIIQGEVGAQAADTGRQWQFLKRDLSEFADATSNLLLPALRFVIRLGRGVIDVLSSIPDWLRRSALMAGFVAATFGPMLIVVAKAAEAFAKLRVALQLLMEGKALANFLTLLKDPRVIVASIAIAAALGGLIYLWQKFRKEAEKPVAMPGLPDVKDILGGNTSADQGDPLKRLKDSAQLLLDAFDRAVQTGDSWETMLGRIVNLQHESYQLWSGSADKMGEMAQEALKIYDQVAKIRDVVNVAGLLSAGGSALATAVGGASRRGTSDTAIQFRIAQQRIDNETSMREREAALRVADSFNAVRQAAVDLGERLRSMNRDFNLAKASLKQQWSSVGNIASSAMAGLKGAVTSVIAALGPMALVALAIGKVLEGLQPVLDAVMQPLIMLGRIVGILLIPVLKPLFEVLKGLGIVVSFLGEIVARVTAAIAKAIGQFLVNLGNLINKLPGSPGNGIKRAGKAMLGFADDAAQSARDLRDARKQLGDMRFGDAADGINNLADAANVATEALTNLPQAFKVNLARYNATLPVSGPSYAYPYGAPGSAPPPSSASPEDAMSSGATVVQLMLDGKVIAQSTLSQLRRASNGQFGTPSRIADLARL